MKITELNILFPVRLQLDDLSYILFVDFASRKVYNLRGEEMAKDMADAILDDIHQQNQTMRGSQLTNIVPEALNIEKEIMEGLSGSKQT